MVSLAFIFFMGCSGDEETGPGSANRWVLTIGDEVIEGEFGYDSSSDHNNGDSPSFGPHYSYRNSDGYYRLGLRNRGIEFDFRIGGVDNPRDTPLQFEGFPDTFSSTHIAKIKYTDDGIFDNGTGFIYQSNPINATEESYTLEVEDYSYSLNNIIQGSNWFFLKKVKLVYTAEVGAITEYVNGIPVSNTDRILPIRLELDFDYNALYPKIVRIDGFTPN